MDNKEQIPGLGINLESLRVGKGKSINKAAREMDISPSALHDWEKGKRVPKLDNSLVLSKYYEVSLDELVGLSINNQIFIEENGIKWQFEIPFKIDAHKGVEIIKSLLKGKSEEAVKADFNIKEELEFEYLIKDIFQSHAFKIDAIPFNLELASKVKNYFDKEFKFPQNKIEVLVFDTSEIESELVKYRLLGETARKYFVENVTQGMKVGFAGGSSIASLVYALRRGDLRNIETYPLATSPVIEAISLDANTLVGTLVYRHQGYGVQGFGLQSIDTTASDSLQYLALQRVLSEAKNVRMAFMGLGELRFHKSPLDLLGGLLDLVGTDYDELEKEAVGDILYHYINAKGEKIDSKKSDLICSINIYDLKRIVNLGYKVVGMGIGKKKHKIARAAFGNRFANVLICDTELAEEIVNPSS